jgi:hypothetical protein
VSRTLRRRYEINEWTGNKRKERREGESKQDRCEKKGKRVKEEVEVMNPVLN